MVSVLDQTVAVNEPATVLATDPSALGDDEPNVAYSWQVGDTATPGLYRAEWIVLFSDGGTATYPNDTYSNIQINRAL
jgi:hypothetical protein